ncbi:Alpha/beta hydrolase family protein [Marinobacter litoralis]|uniref:Alpha/beta hydrolase family protein n=1 Tax=Marinobacter litoralis TaxID=187981 RepID=A0A3M2RKZ7_9GAMM|nr:Alpha/beta hydrolase family protein [Marinobacter litoralis]
MIPPDNIKVKVVVRITSKSYSQSAKAVLILAHGAGAPADSPFMEQLAGELEKQGIACVRFEFPYMQKRREDGKKRPPDRAPVLLEAFKQQIQQVRAEVGSQCRLVIGGKSMGGRMASLVASEGDAQVDAVVCFGYPFHPPGKLDRWRIDHLPDVSCPLLVLQGTRDPFGKPEELDALGSIKGIARLRWLDGGNHDFATLVRHPLNQSDLIREAAKITRQFLEDYAGG